MCPNNILNFYFYNTPDNAKIQYPQLGNLLF